MLSFFMVNRLPLWDEMHQHSNLTKSSIMNDLISFVKKKETRGQGKESKADCALSTASSSKFWIPSIMPLWQTSTANIPMLL